MLSLAQTKTPEQTLMDIEHSWAATALKNDVKTLDGILAANWTGITPEGTVLGRAESLANTKASKFTKSEVSGMKVMMLNPTTAVVTGIWTGRGHRCERRKGRYERALDGRVPAAGHSVEVRRFAVDDDQEMRRVCDAPVEHRPWHRVRRGSFYLQGTMRLDYAALTTDARYEINRQQAPTRE